MDTSKYSAENIKALDWMEHVRLRSYLYFQKCFDDKLLDTLPLEAACHALDEFMDGNCTQIEIGVSPDFFLVNYNAGMSLQVRRHGETFAEIIMTKIGACSNHKKHLEVGQEFCELGIATINAASAECRLVTVSGSQKGVFVFQEGKLISKSIEPSTEANGTSIYFKPNPAIFGDLKLTLSGIAKKSEDIMKKLPKLNITVIEHKKTGL